MKKILDLITGKVSAAFAAAGYDPSNGRVTVSNRPDLCEYQCNGALSAAKKYHKAPFVIADEVLAKAMEEQSPDLRYIIGKAETEEKYVYHTDALTFNSLKSKLFTLLDELGADRYGKQTQVSIYIQDLLLTLNRHIYEQDRSRSVKENRGRYEEITGYIDLHLDEELSLDRLAKEFFLSKYYLVHLFQDSTGLSVHQYIIKKRLEACCDSMLNGASVSEAYRQWGFGDYSAFYRAFRKEYGMPPSSFLELHRM